jgi:benzaldehyde dehydrogenase (NAD)
VVILTTWELDEYVFDGLRAGASGFLGKDSEPSELLRAIRVVAAGDALLSPGATRRLIADLVARIPSGAVHINDQTVQDEAHIPFGGVGISGTGVRLGGSEANLDAFTETQWVTIRGEIASYPF